jgi:peptidoglycan/LPS O-acetylase OafA/YrhL
MSELRTDAPASTVSTFRADIQGLRAVAVILVILAHASFPGLSGGFQGVDIFFVISGYVITSNLLRHEHPSIRASLVDFYARRIRRIVPAATVVLCVSVVVAYWTLGKNFDPTLLTDARWATLFSANFRFIATGAPYFIPGVQPSLIQHYWSLAVEEQFYFAWPLVLYVTSRLAGQSRLMALRVVLVVVIVASGLWALHANSVNSIAAYFSPFTRAYELGLGALAAVLPTAWRWLTEPRRRALAWGAAVALVLSVFVLRTSTNFPGAAAWWPCLATMVLLWVGAETVAPSPATWLSQRWLGYIGDRSYSLYLWHFLWLMLPLQLVNPISGWFARCVEILGAFVCAIVSYRFLERPIRTSRRLSRDPIAVFTLLACCVFLVWDVTEIVGHLAGAG